MSIENNKELQIVLEYLDQQTYLMAFECNDRANRENGKTHEQIKQVSARLAYGLVNSMVKAIQNGRTKVTDIENIVIEQRIG